MARTRKAGRADDEAKQADDVDVDAENSASEDEDAEAVADGDDAGGAQGDERQPTVAELAAMELSSDEDDDEADGNSGDVSSIVTDTRQEPSLQAPMVHTPIVDGEVTFESVRVLIDGPRPASLTGDDGAYGQSMYYALMSIGFSLEAAHAMMHRESLNTADKCADLDGSTIKAALKGLSTDLKGAIKDKYGLLIKPVYVPAVTQTNFYALCLKFKFVKLTEGMVYPKDVGHKIGTIPEFVQLNKILGKFEYSETSMFTNKPELDKHDHAKNLADLDDFLRGIRTTSGTSVAYLARRNKKVPIVKARLSCDSIDDYMITHTLIVPRRENDTFMNHRIEEEYARLLSQEVGEANRLLYRALEYFYKDTDSMVIIKAYKKTADGMGAHIALKKRYMGAEWLSHSTEDAISNIEHARYKGESRSGRHSWDAYCKVFDKNWQIVQNNIASGHNRTFPPEYLGEKFIRGIDEGISTKMDAALAAAQGDKKLLSDINALQNRIYTALPAASGNRRDKRNVAAVAGKGSSPGGKKKARFTGKLVPDVRYENDDFRRMTKAQKNKLYAMRPAKDEDKASGSAASVPNSKYESVRKELNEYKRKVAELTSEQKSGRSNSRSRSSSVSPSPAKRSSSKSRAIRRKS